MPIRHRICGTRFSSLYIVFVIAMAVILVGIVFYLFCLTISKGQSDILSYSRAEPVWLGGKNGSTVVFPFERDLWMSNSSTGPCPKHYFICNSSRKCLVLDKRCDGNVDCPMAEDELNCVCAFRMPSSKFCDKYPDCFDESDESFCSYCPEKSFNCGDGKCIPKNKVCDTVMDCDNFMDENFCFRLSPNVTLSGMDGPDPSSPTSGETLRTGYLLRNRNGKWYPVCANPNDHLQNTLASFACVGITANPLASSSHQYRKFGLPPERIYGDFLYHHQGKFILWRGCLSARGIYINCNDVRCGLNPQQLLPKRPRGRIVGGEISAPGSWPWHAAVYKNGTYSCGSTLINNHWLLSAAHCFLNYQYNYYEIQLGMLRRKSFTPHQRTYRIDKIVPHPQFNIITLEYDIVMLKTAQDVDFNFWIRPICLPNPARIETSGSFCTAIGWGDTGETLDDSPDDLAEVHVPLTKDCKRNHDRWLCAGFVQGGRDACQGDSGGPLMCMSGDGLSWYIAGIISAGTGCARARTPGMYTRVVYFLDWISRTMLSRSAGDMSPLLKCPGLTCAALGGGNCLREERVCDKTVDCYTALDEMNCAQRQH